MKKVPLFIILIFFSESLLSQLYVSESTSVVLRDFVNLSIGGDLRHEGSLSENGQLKLIRDQAQSISREGLIEYFSIDKGSGQAEVTNTRATSISINFNESYKDISQLQAASFNQESRIDVLLHSNSKTIDAVSLKLKAGANSEVDLRDAKKSQNYDEGFSIYSQGRHLSIEERDFPEEIDTVMLSLKNKRKSAYQFKVNSSNVSETDIVLKDFYLDLEYPINEGEFTVDYQVAEGEPDLRYGFIIEPNSLSNEDMTPQNFKVFPNPVNDRLNIQVLNSSSESYRFSIYSLLGKKVDAGQFKSTSSPFNYDSSSLSTGVYLVSIIGENNQKETVKLIKL